MSPASKSKSKKSAKDLQKATSKPSAATAAGAAVAPSAYYNPLLGAFHALDSMTPYSAAPLQSNGRLRNIDETDEHAVGSLGSTAEYDSVSNNGSCSGESEDHKEKASNHPVRQEAIPGPDNDKQEKVRQRNERKHQRQKERRAQELQEKCCGFLMSRKLEGLAQQLVAMGFPHEKATEALIMNEGKLEESVSWLFEGGGEADKYKESAVGGANLKIDISEELAKLASLEIKYKCTKQEVERVVVAAEGDLEQAEEALKTPKQDPPAPPKPEETNLPPANNGKLAVTSTQNLVRTQQHKPIPHVQPRDEHDFNYSKAATAVLGPSESVAKRFQQFNRIPPTMESVKSQQTAMESEKWWPNAGVANPSVSYPLASTVQTSASTKIEHGYALVGSDSMNLHSSVREPVVMMQRAQSMNSRPVPASSASSALPGSAVSRFPSSSFDIMKSNGFMAHAPSSRSLSSNNLSTSQMFHQLNHMQQQYHTATNVGDSSGTGPVNGLWSRAGALPPVAAASSLGLFSGVGSTSSSGATSPVNWSTGGSAAQLDYTNVDWSLGLNSASSKSTSALWMGASSLKSATIYNPNPNSFSDKQAMRLSSSGLPIPGVHHSGAAGAGASGAVSREWTSPFEGKDLFSLPRQSVASPLI